MNRPENAARPAERRPRGRVARALLLALAALLLMQYLAGYFFLLRSRLEPRSTTPLTSLRFALHYGDHPAVRRGSC